jgi:MiaB/RimO family radical SAM methylthiotransferase
MIVSTFDSLIGNGIKEVLVTAQDTGCYGSDVGTDLPSLLRKMLENKEDFRIRIGMMNPNSLLPVLDSLLDVMADPRIYKFLHIPVQSGSDSVLKRMNRYYSAGEFLGLVEKIRTRYPDVSISTDLISGFPGETDGDHMKSIELLEELSADNVNITRFSSRPGTGAASMEQVHGRISKDRSTDLTVIRNKIEYENNVKLIGKRERALITEAGKEGTMIARTDNYRQVVICSDLPIGSFISVEITGCKPAYLLGRVLTD